jgi:cell shape-determining protein MreD
MIGWTRQWTLFTFVLITAHFLLHVALGMGGLAPDLLAVAALLGARRLPIAGGAVLGFVIGLLADAFAVTGFAATGLGLAVACAGGAYSRDFFEGESLIFNAVYLLGGATIATLVAEIFAGRTGGQLFNAFFGAVLAGTYTAVAGIAALAAYRRLAGPRV